MKNGEATITIPRNTITNKYGDDDDDYGPFSIFSITLKETT